VKYEQGYITDLKNLTKFQFNKPERDNMRLKLRQHTEALESLNKELTQLNKPSKDSYFYINYPVFVPPEVFGPAEPCALCPEPTTPSAHQSRGQGLLVPKNLTRSPSDKGKSTSGTKDLPVPKDLTRSPSDKGKAKAVSRAQSDTSSDEVVSSGSDFKPQSDSSSSDTSPAPSLLALTPPRPERVVNAGKPRMRGNPTRCPSDKGKSTSGTKGLPVPKDLTRSPSDKGKAKAVSRAQSDTDSDEVVSSGSDFKPQSDSSSSDTSPAPSLLAEERALTPPRPERVYSNAGKPRMRPGKRNKFRCPVGNCPAVIGNVRQHLNTKCHKDMTPVECSQAFLSFKQHRDMLRFTEPALANQPPTVDEDEVAADIPGPGPLPRANGHELRVRMQPGKVSGTAGTQPAPASRTKRIRNQFKCPVCDKVVCNYPQHLQRHEKKGTDNYHLLKNRAINVGKPVDPAAPLPRVQPTDAEKEMRECLDLFRKYKTNFTAQPDKYVDADAGKLRRLFTLMAQFQGVPFSKRVLRGIHQLGEVGNVMSIMSGRTEVHYFDQENALKLKTLKIYCFTLKQFIAAANRHGDYTALREGWFDPLDNDNNAIAYNQSIDGAIRRIEVGAEKKRHVSQFLAANQGYLNDLDAWSRFCDSDIMMQIRQRLHQIEECGVRIVDNTLFCLIRNNIMLHLALSNLKRAGEVAHFTVGEFENGVWGQDKNGHTGYVCVVERGKTTDSQPCVICLRKDMVKVVKDYIALVRPYRSTLHPNPRKYNVLNSDQIFLTHTGYQVESSDFGPGIESAWQAFGKSIGETALRKIGTRTTRPDGVTAHRTDGADDAEKNEMCRQMGHSRTTSNRYYDRTKGADESVAATYRFRTALRREGKKVKKVKEFRKKHGMDMTKPFNTRIRQRPPNKLQSAPDSRPAVRRPRPKGKSNSSPVSVSSSSSPALSSSSGHGSSSPRSSSSSGSSHVHAGQSTSYSQQSPHRSTPVKACSPPSSTDSDSDSDSDLHVPPHSPASSPVKAGSPGSPGSSESSQTLLDSESDSPVPPSPPPQRKVDFVDQKRAAVSMKGTRNRGGVIAKDKQAEFNAVIDEYVAHILVTGKKVQTADIFQHISSKGAMGRQFLTHPTYSMAKYRKDLYDKVYHHIQKRRPRPSRAK